MFNCSLRLFCVLGILCFGSSHVKSCMEKDRQALLKLKDGFNNQDLLSSYWNDKDCCKWKGVSCDNLTGHVTSLDLHSNYSVALGGKIDPSICELQHLTSLDLTSNELRGNIPNCIGSLGQLIELKLAKNYLDSVIPPTLGNLSNLQTLDLEGTYYLVVNDLEWLSHLSNLKYLNLSYNNLSRSFDWLSSISKIPSLIELSLHDCGLPQVNPKSIPQVNSSTSFKNLTYLDLSNNFLHSIPDVFGNMISLQYLDLSNNELEGGLPKSFRNLCHLEVLRVYSNKLFSLLSDCIQQLCGPQNSLEWLDLSDNPFSRGPLPDFSWLSSLTTLSLRNTNIIGPLPQLFGHMPHLVSLDLSLNQLSGSLSSFEVSKVASLEFLDLSHNQLNGTLPYNIGKLSNLEMLAVHSNNLNGVISEAHLSSLSRLKYLKVAQNSLSFNLSSNWVPPFQLWELHASSCILGPKFPTWLKHQRELEKLDISNSSISDSFPKWFWDLSSSLLHMNVSHNQLSGGLPKTFPSLKIEAQAAWDFSFNNLSGPLPPFPAKIYSLFLSNNMFSGSMSSFCATSNVSLTYLDLSNNLLDEPLLDCWGKFQSLQVLDLAKNNLSGRIPESLGTLENIQSLSLNNNNFSGEVPSLALCSSLTFIDFGNNNLQGTLPTWIGHHLHQLIVLRLQENNFQGKIPVSLCNLLCLQVLDLSQNNITGEIPQCFSDISALSDMKFPRKPIFYSPYAYRNIDNVVASFIDKAVLAWKGKNREYGKLLGLMTTIDLSCNHLTGEIPQSITKLVALAGLNLSRNHLTGFIPNNIGQMEMLESLDLSRNHLYGKMPTSFSNLSFLSYMNLSFNNLSGKIPTSTQLQSFDASTYISNNGLCGPPLTNHCPWDVISPTGSPDKHITDEDEDGIITLGFYISMVLGFFVGFWGVCGTLVIKASWRHSYFQFVNNMSDWIHVTLAVFMARMKRDSKSKTNR
ncbi:Leucine-rich repeat [Sesbania bispinosa]|nr:Leucine-rich repeat [Sesbania bispinosa]